MNEYYAYPFLALLFVGIFCREVIAPASRNACDRRWLILSAGLGVLTVIVSLGIGYYFSSFIKNSAFFVVAKTLPDAAVGLLSFFASLRLVYFLLVAQSNSSI